MKFETLLRLVGKEPVFSSGLLLAGGVLAEQVRLQLSRWVKSGRLLQLRRGLYILAPAWRKVEPHPFLAANALQQGSYVSLQSALAFHGAIREYVPVVTNVGPGRPETVRNPLGSFQYHHLTKDMLFGYARVEVAAQQFAFVAAPEKALLDLVHLTPGADSLEYIQELRLQFSKSRNPHVLMEMAERSGKPKLIRTARIAAPFWSAQEGELVP